MESCRYQSLVTCFSLLGSKPPALPAYAQDLLRLLQDCVGGLVATTGCVPRIAPSRPLSRTSAAAFADAEAVPEPAPGLPFPDSIAADREGAPKALEAIERCMAGIVDKVASSYEGCSCVDSTSALPSKLTSAVSQNQVQTLLLSWEKKYKAVWDQDREAFMR